MNLKLTKIDISVVTNTRSFSLDHKKVAHMATEFMEYAIRTPGLALIYDKSENLLLLIEQDFRELEEEEDSILKTRRNT